MKHRVARGIALHARVARIISRSSNSGLVRRFPSVGLMRSPPSARGMNVFAPPLAGIHWP
eukprot:4598223-Pyramimonas_sp.AAC.1